MPRRPSPLRILFVTPECAPWVKTGGLGDVSAALPRALAALGHEVHVFMPAYRALRPLIASSARKRTLPARGPWPEAQVVHVEADGLCLALLDCPGFYDRDGGPYTDVTGRDHEDTLRRFAFLSHAAVRVATEGPRPADVLHANDWPTGLAPAYLSDVPDRTTAGVFTIHNLAFQGNFPADRAAALGMPPHWQTVDGLLHWEQLCLMKGGIRYADEVTTVSPTYAQEIQTPDFGCGLDGLLRHRAADLHGLLNGIESRHWDPATDPLLPYPYQADRLDGKRLDKRALQQQVGLAETDDAMVFGMVSRMTEQKGVDLVLDSLDWLVAEGHQVVALGQGDARFEAAWRDAAQRHPGRVAATIGFREDLAHLIEAGCDAFLMPSRFEPCGLNQMYSQRYGTPPIVHRTGGLADSVTDAADTDGGTGFLFAPATGQALRDAVARAIALWRDPARWNALVRRGMARTFDWADSARAYEALYRDRLAQLPGRRMA